MLGPSPLTQFEVGAGLAAGVRVQNQQADFEEEAVRGHVEAAHLVETVAAHHQSDDADPLPHHVHVVDDPVHSCFQNSKKSVNVQILNILYLSMPLCMLISLELVDDRD